MVIHPDTIKKLYTLSDKQAGTKSRVDATTLKTIALHAAVGELLADPSYADDFELRCRLADVVIRCNLIEIGLSGLPVRHDDHVSWPSPSMLVNRLNRLARHAGRAAYFWALILEDDSRCGNLGGFSAALRLVVQSAHTTPHTTPTLPISARADRMLALPRHGL